MNSATVERPIEEAAAAAPEQNRFAITDERSANWLLRKLSAIRSERETITAQVKQRISELKADEDRLLHLYQDQLATWAQGEAEKRRRRTVSLLYGSLSFRRSPAAVKLIDQDEALKHAQQSGFGTAVVLDSATYREEAERRFAETGELLPGVTLQPEEDRFSIRFPKASSGGSGEEEL